MLAKEKKNIKNRNSFIFENSSQKIREETKHLIKEMQLVREAHMKVTLSFNKLRINYHLYVYNHELKEVVKVATLNKESNRSRKPRER